MTCQNDNHIHFAYPLVLGCQMHRAPTMHLKFFGQYSMFRHFYRDRSRPKTYNTNLKSNSKVTNGICIVIKKIQFTVKKRVTGSMTIDNVSCSSSVKQIGYGNTSADSTLPRKKFATNE